MAPKSNHSCAREIVYHLLGLLLWLVSEEFQFVFDILHRRLPNHSYHLPSCIGSEKTSPDLLKHHIWDYLVKTLLIRHLNKNFLHHSFFLVLETSALALISESKVVCIDSIALCEFLHWLSFSSSFSRILLSISCLIWASSTWRRRTFDSSASIAPSASSRAAWRSLRSTSIARLDFSTSWRALPDSAQL